MTAHVPPALDPMSALCRMVAATRYEDLPPEVVAYARHSVLDTVGVIMGGSAMEGIPAVVDLVKDKGGKPESLLPFHGGRVPASEAGLALGSMARAMDLGDVHDEAGHASEYTVPALLAASGAVGGKVSGKDFIAGYVLGQEVLVRIGMAFKGISQGLPRGRANSQYIFGAAASAARLLGLSLDQMEDAEGIVSTMTQPSTMALYKPPTNMVRIHHGFVCQGAINACLLARRGVTGPRQGVLTGPSGYLGLAAWETDPSVLTRALGQKWEMTATMRKRYCANMPSHPAISAVLALKQEHGFEARDIAAIHVDASSTGWQGCVPREQKWDPKTVGECQFSLPYLVATAALDGDVFLDSHTPEARGRPAVRDLMARITASEDRSQPSWAARVAVTLTTGRRHVKEYVYGGDPHSASVERDLVAKFRKCVPYAAYRPGQAAVDSVIDALLHLDQVDDVVAAVLAPLTPEERPR